MIYVKSFFKINVETEMRHICTRIAIFLWDVAARGLEGWYQRTGRDAVCVSRAESYLSWHEVIGVLSYPADES
jgi:hypothetical protein